MFQEVRIKINGLFYLLISGIYWAYNPLILTIPREVTRAIRYSGFSGSVQWVLLEISWKPLILTSGPGTSRHQALQDRSAADGWRNVAGSTREIQRRNSSGFPQPGKKGCDLLMHFSVLTLKKKASFFLFEMHMILLEYNFLFGKNTNMINKNWGLQ